MKKINAIRMAVGEAPQRVVIGDDLASLQAAVGGYIELVSLDSKTDAYVNGEGLLEGLPFNCVLPTTYNPQGVPVVGSVIVVSHDGEGDTVGLTEQQISEWMPRLAAASRDLGSVLHG